MLSLLGTASLPMQASAENATNQAAIPYSAGAIAREIPPTMDVLMSRFFAEIGTSDDIVFDRVLGPASQLAWTRRQISSGYASIDRFNADGAGMVEKIGVDSLRTAAVEAFPVELWQDHWLGWLGDFLTGTLGNPEEEDDRITSIASSAVRSRWESQSQSSSLQWGARPWNTSPYVYLLSRGGHFEGKSLLTLETRMGYSMSGSGKFENRLTLQLPASFRLAASASLDPGRIGSSDPRASYFGITLERVINTDGLYPTGMFYIGFRSGARGDSSNPRHENMIVAGLFKRL
jgi:hypothetical protein